MTGAGATFRNRKARALALVATGALALGAAARSEPDKPQASPQAQVLEVLARSKDVRDVKLDQGSENGVAERQVFDVLRETSAYALPLSGNAKLRVNRELVAHAVVYSVQPKAALARLFDEKPGTKVEAHQSVVLNPLVKAPGLEPFVRSYTPAEKSPQAQAVWRSRIPIALDVEVLPGRLAYYEWRSPGGGSFTRGTEVAPGVFRTVLPANEWIAPIQAKTYQINVTIADSATPKPTLHTLKLESLGPKQDRAANPRVQRTLFEKKKYEGIRDVAFDGRNTLWLLDGTSGALSGHEFLRGTTADGYDMGSVEVTKGNFAALAVNDSYFYFLDLKDTCVKRYSKGGQVASLLSSEPVRIGESGSGNGRFKDPVDLALLPDGGVLVLDNGQRCVHRFDRDGRFVCSFGHPGEGDHDLKDPVALAVAHDGTVFVLDNGRKRVVIYKDGRVEREDIEAGAGNEDLRGIAVDDFGLSVALLDRNAGVVKLFNQNRDGWLIASKSTSQGSDDVAFLKKPSRIRMDATRVVYAVDKDGESLARFDAADRVSFCGRMGNVELSDAVRLSASADGGVVALDRSKSVAIRFDRRGWAIAKMGFDSQDGQLKTPVGVGVDGDGSVAVLDAKKCEVEQYGRGGVWLKRFGSETNLQKIRNGQISSQRERFLVVMRGDKPSIGVMELQTGEVRKFPVADADDLELCAFSGAFEPKDPKDDEGVFWVVDKSGERVSHFTLRNTTPAEVTQPFKNVTGIAANAAGAVFLCDRKTRTIEVYSGKGVKLGSITDEKELESPSDVTTDDLGRLYVFDDSKVRIIELAE